MGYVKVAYKKIFRILDDSPYPPKEWNNFVKKQEINHNLIIKSRKNKCFCTNCHHQFISAKKINEEIKCPNCHNKYLIKRSNLKSYEFKDYLSILDIVDDTFVIRYFELRTIIDDLHEHHSSVVEFAREIINKSYYREIFVNDRVSRCQCYNYIHHSNYFDSTKWRKYIRNYSLIDYSIVFSNNLKSILKNTEYKYSCIWNLAKHSTYIDLSSLLEHKYDIPKVELLTKMKLYNLALSANRFYNNGSFQESFGVSKDFYPFMRRNNITFRQLKILRLLKEKNIQKIRYLEKFIHYGDNIDDLEEISNYISLNRFIKYSKMHRGKIRTYIYKDYLRFAKLLGFDLKNNRYAFPKKLEEEHDKLKQLYKIQNEKAIQKAIIKRSKKLLINKYQNDKFIIFPAKSLKELKNESIQQNNCVQTYAEKYASGICDIYLMRDIKNQNKSLVTVEVKNSKVVQSRIKNNDAPNEKQLQFLYKWEQNVLKGVA